MERLRWDTPGRAAAAARAPTTMHSGRRGLACVDGVRAVMKTRLRMPTTAPRRHRHQYQSRATLSAEPLTRRARQQAAPTLRRWFVVAGKSSKSSKSGRFPATPCVECHPLQSSPPPTSRSTIDSISPRNGDRRAIDDATAAQTSGGRRVGGGVGVGVGRRGGGGDVGGGEADEGDAIGRLCAGWRAAAGKPGASVMREVHAMLNPNDDGHTPASRSTDADTDWRLLLSCKDENLYNAYALEVAALSPGSYGGVDTWHDTRGRKIPESMP